MTPLLLAGAVALALITGALWFREHDARVRDAALAQRSRDSLVTVAAETARYARAAYTADSARAAAQIRQRDAALAAEHARGTKARDSLTALLGALPLILPDSLGPWAEGVRAQWAAHLADDQRERQAADDALAARDSAYAALQRTYARDIGAVRSQLATAIRQLDAANRRARPGLLSRALQVAPWAGAAFVAGRVVR